MPELQKQAEREYEETLRSAEFIGRNTYGQHSALLPGEFRELQNFELYPRYLKSRRGSQYLGTAINSGVTIRNRVVWDIGTEEYVLFQQGTHIKYHRINPVGTLIYNVVDFSGVDIELSNSNRADMFLDGDKLFIMHEGGNKIIHWSETGSVFEGRAMGLDYPYIESIANVGGAGNLLGDYIWAVEIIYFPDDLADVSYSSPNRFTIDRTLAKLTTDTDGIPTIVVQADELDAYDWWTHIRLWRTRRLDVDNDDQGTITEPVGPFGVEDELFLVAEITKAEMEATGLQPVATSTNNTKPAGNEFVEAGTVSGSYTITDKCTDIYLDGAVFVDIDRIELIPLPSAKVGVSHADRIFISSIQQTTLTNGDRIDDDSKNDIWYGNYANSPYSELTKTIQIKPTQRDGQNMIRLISFEKDLIGLKESKTIRLPDGFVELNVETVDHRIGVKEPEYAEFIPGLGICALTNDYDDFAIWGYDNVWRKTFNNIDISRHVREDMKDIVNDANTQVSFIYINGKVMFSDGSGNSVYVLHVESGRGWSKYEYPVEFIEKLFVFAGGRKAGYIARSSRFVEIEVEDLDTDIDLERQEAVPIELTYDTWMWQSGDGADVLEQSWLSVMAYLGNPMSGAPYVNGLPWPDKTTPLGWSFVGQDGGEDSLADREYRLFIKPQTIGTFKWMPPVGNFIHHRITTEAPALMKVHKLRCIIDTDGISFGGFDPYQLYSEPYGPEWNFVSGDIVETGDSGDDTTTEDGSGSTDTITELGE